LFLTYSRNYTFTATPDDDDDKALLITSNFRNTNLASSTTEDHLVGYDEESKGHKICWKTKSKVTFKRDISFDANDARLSETARPEGETGIKITPEQIKPLSANSERIVTPKRSHERLTSALSNESAWTKLCAPSPNKESI
jgi:hypothetical protein